MKHKKIFIHIALAGILISCAKFPEQIYQAGVPQFDIPGGIYGHAIHVSLATNTSGSEIFYTTDGSIPTKNSLKYTAPIALTDFSETYTIRTRAYKEGLQESEIAEASYTIVTYTIEDQLYWNKLLSSSAATVVAFDSENNIYCCGYVVGATSGRDWLIRKFSNDDGKEDTTNWNKHLDGNGGVDSVKGIVIDGSNVYVAGIGTNLVSNASGVDWWIKKFDNNGVEDTVNWKDKFYDGRGGDDFINDLRLDSAGNIYVIGNGVNLVSGTSKDDLWIKKFSPSGVEDTVNWNKMIDGEGDEDYLNQAAIDSSDNLYIAGCGKKLVGTMSGFDWWVKKFDKNGVEDTVNWNKKIDGKGGNDYPNSIAIDLNDNVYVAGSGENIFNSSSQSDWWIKKFSSSGVEDSVNWNKIYDGGKAGNDYINSIAVDKNGNVFIAGAGYQLIDESNDFDWWMEKFTPSGVIDTVYKSSSDTDSSKDYANSIIIDSYNKVYVAGYSEYVEAGVTKTDGWVKKFYY